jgi:hypothetical protein
MQEVKQLFTWFVGAVFLSIDPAGLRTFYPALKNQDAMMFSPAKRIAKQWRKMRVLLIVSMNWKSS